MRYLLQIYSAGMIDVFERLPADEQEAVREELRAVERLPGVVGAARLQPVETATTVRVENGQSLLIDGPFVDAKEHVGGFVLVARRSTARSRCAAPGPTSSRPRSRRCAWTSRTTGPRSQRSTASSPG